jgi:hypothetical protein
MKNQLNVELIDVFILLMFVFAVGMFLAFVFMGNNVHKCLDNMGAVYCHANDTVGREYNYIGFELVNDAYVFNCELNLKNWCDFKKVSHIIDSDLECYMFYCSE